MRIWHDNITLEQFRAVEKGTAVEHCDVLLTELGDDYITGSMTIAAQTQTPDGSMHGGAPAILAESLASLAANGVIDRSRFACLGQQINLNHLKTVALGETITGTARAFSIADQTHVWGVTILNGSSELVCVSRVMMAVVPRPANAAAFLSGLSAN